MRRCLFIILLLVLGALQPLGAKIERPDFKKPRTVAAKALKNLEQANKKHNDRAAVEAVLQLVTAISELHDDRQTLRGPQPDSTLNFYNMPGIVQRQIKRTDSSDALAMLWLIKADTYLAIYQSAYDKYDRRNIPIDPVPDDMLQWSRAQFEREVTGCFKHAYNHAGNTPLTKWDNIIDYDANSLLVWPGVRDFVVLRAWGNTLMDKTQFETMLTSVLKTHPSHSYPKLYWQQIQLKSQGRGGEIKALYKAEQDYETSCLLLSENHWGYDLEGRRQYVQLMRKALSRWPKFPGRKSLEYQIDQLTRSDVGLTCPSQCAVNVPCSISVHYSNLEGSAGFVVHKDKHEIARVTFNDKRQTPYSADTVLTFVPPHQGDYEVRPLIGDEVGKEWCELEATVYTAVSIGDDRLRGVVAIDSRTGQPAAHAQIDLKDVRGMGANIDLGRTAADGLLRVDSLGCYGAKLPSYVAAHSNYHININGLDCGGMAAYYDDAEYSESSRAHIITDRALYRPGDTVKWCVIAYRGRDGQSRPLANRPLKISMRASDSSKDSIVVVTDDWGRADGSFLVPTGRVMEVGGYVQLSVQDIKERLGYTWLEVSDFVLPQIRVRIDSIDTRQTADSITVIGHATNYADVPVAGAKVMLSNNRQVWWRWDVEAVDYIASGTTAADGSFALTFAAARTPYTSTNTVQVTVVSKQGERAAASRNYLYPRPYLLQCYGGVIDTDSAKPLPVGMYNAQEPVTDIPLKWQLTRQDSIVVARGNIDAVDSPVDWSAIPSGEYTLQVSVVDSLLAFDARATVTLYSIRHNTAPDGKLLFAPQTRISGTSGSVVRIPYFTPAAATVYAVTVNDAETDFGYAVLYKDRGYAYYEVRMPAEGQKATVVLTTVRDGSPETVRIQLSGTAPKLPAIGIESFRDKINAGGRERWRLRFGVDSISTDSWAGVALAYNSALDALMPYRLETLPKLYGRRHRTDMLRVDVRYSYNQSASQKLKSKLSSVGWLLRPGFAYTPTMEYAPGIWMRTSDLGIYGARSAYGVSRNGPITEEHIVVGYTNRKLAAAPAGNQVESNMMDTADDAGTPAEPTPADATMSTYDFRPAEQLQALWLPRLVSGADGVLTVEFDAPVTNGAWTLHALGWNREMQSAALSREFVTRRPVMVHSVLPRFLRQGDEAIVQATVSSGMERAAKVSVAFELFDLGTDSVFQRVSRTVELQPDSTIAVSATITAPDRARTIGCRVLAVSGNYSDGEQADIPVLLAGIQVRDADFTFYPDGAQRSDIKLPPAQPGVRTWLDFCDRPVDNVAKIIESVSTNEPKDVIAASAQIYYATVAAQLKAAGMPLGCDSLLQVARTRAVELLTDCHRSAGGWSWGKWQSNPSEWLTYGVLRDIAGSGDSRLDSLAMKALEFVQTCALADHDFAPGPNFDFTEVCALYPQFKPSQLGRSLIDLTVKYVAKDWDKAYITQLPRYALLLQAYGHRGEARKILQSIDEYTVREDNGLVWIPKIKDIDAYATLIEAYNRLEPSGPQLRGMQAWLIRRTVATDNFSACRPVRIIQALLPLVREARPMAWAAVYRESTQHAADIPASQSDRLSVSRRLLVREVEGLRPADSLELGQQVVVELTVKATEDMDYVELTDMLPAGLQVVEQLGGSYYEDGVGYYYQPGATEVKMYIDTLPRGTHILTYRLTAATAGRFATGMAVVQSLRDPSATAHSAATRLTVE